MLARQEEIIEVMTDPGVLDESGVWFDFLKAIYGKIHQLTASKDPEDHYEYVVLNSRCG